MSVTIAPVRLILVMLILLLDCVIAKIALGGLTEQQLATKPMKGWRRMLLYPLWLLGRFQFFLMGFHYISVKGKKATCEEVPIFIIAPHTTFFDAIIVFVLGLESSSVVSREENGKAPLFGILVRALQPVFVSRTDPHSRQNTVREIIRRSQPGSEWPQILIFPEGTCANRTCLISFKPGAFYPGLPVQPVALHYKTKPDTVIWTWEGPNALTCLWLTFCNWNNELEVEFLPVYKPNDEEKKDAKLFARNVRDVIAKAMDIPVTDHTFEDCRLMMEASKIGLPMEAGIVEFHKIMVKLGLKLSDVQEQLPKYAEIAKSKGYISIEDFAEYLKLPISPALEEVFAMYDRDGSGNIDFREYVIGCSLVAKPASNEKTLTLAFKLFGGEKGYITKEELVQILESSFTMADNEAEELFNQVDEAKSGEITFDQFKAFADKKPEYATLFKTFQELSEAESYQEQGNLNFDKDKND
ncbi:lysophosphatidylcholine acyltransferase 2-like isoform X2 [Anneissia japonica]|nr:lysophosphatidylcholine acyltransferase 2-like isoform X2 [Anneissia japonica]XP_033124680.1 lysophosphatidylcholine acyltransferase 2-like isoform X2 [Anneissia japonica]